MDLSMQALAQHWQNAKRDTAEYLRGKARDIREKSRPGIDPLPAGTTMKDLRVLTATWFGAGRLRPAPGTIGTAAGIPFGILISLTLGPFGLFAAALSLLYVGTLAADYYGEKSGKTDDQTIVVDEVVGVWLAAVPAENHWELWALAFVLFRFFDIVKPWPASWFDDRGKGGFDVMMDDVVAGIFAFLGVGSIACFYL